MREGIVAQVRERLRRRREQRARQDAPEEQPVSEIAAEFTTEELQEFLEGDLHPVEADPVFKEELRQNLWLMVRRRYRSADERDPDDSL
jgi:hypothetical protein